MDPISPVVVEAFHLLHADLYDHLHEAEFLAGKCRGWTQQDADTARELIPDLVDIIREVLSEHEAQPSGECRHCSSAWPCRVVTTIHARVKDPDREIAALVRRAHDGG